MPEVMHKSLQFDVASIDEEQGIFDGYASVWDVIDHDGDVVEHGAFAYTIREGVAKDGVPILALHNDHWLPVGRTLELREDDVGLYIRGYISPTSMGKDVRILIRDKVLAELLAEGKDLIAQLRALGVEVPDDGAEDLIEIEDEETEE